MRNDECGMRNAECGMINVERRNGFWMISRTSRPHFLGMRINKNAENKHTILRIF